MVYPTFDPCPIHALIRTGAGSGSRLPLLSPFERSHEGMTGVDFSRMGLSCLFEWMMGLSFSCSRINNASTQKLTSNFL